MVQLSLHPADAARQAGRGRRRPARATRWASTRRWSCTPRPMGPDFTFFVVYGPVHHLVDLRKVEVVERDYPLLTPKEVNAAIKRALRRRLVVVGACIGTDAHTVGIDAILNIKGFAGEKGLEYYREIKVVNLGAQVLVPELVDAGPEPRGPTRCWSPRSSPSATRTCTTPGRCRRRSGRPTRPARRPLLVVGGPRFDEAIGRRARRRPGLRPGHDARRGGALPRPRARHARPERRPERAQRRPARGRR